MGSNLARAAARQCGDRLDRQRVRAAALNFARDDANSPAVKCAASLAGTTPLIACRLRRSALAWRSEDRGLLLAALLGRARTPAGLDRRGKGKALPAANESPSRARPLAASAAAAQN